MHFGGRVEETQNKTELVCNHCFRMAGIIYYYIEDRVVCLTARSNVQYCHSVSHSMSHTVEVQYCLPTHIPLGVMALPLHIHIHTHTCARTQIAMHEYKHGTHERTFEL